MKVNMNPAIAGKHTINGINRGGCFKFPSGEEGYQKVEHRSSSMVRHTSSMRNEFVFYVCLSSGIVYGTSDHYKEVIPLDGEVFLTKKVF